MSVYRNKKITQGAEGRPCVLCGHIGTTVAAHSNALDHGHGYGLKCPDYMVAYVCQLDHDIIDGRAGKLTKDQKREMWLKAWILTIKIIFEEGIVK